MLVEIKIGEYVDAPNHAPNGCRLIGIWNTKAWLLFPHGGTTVAPIDSIIPTRTTKEHQNSVIVKINDSD